MKGAQRRSAVKADGVRPAAADADSPLEGPNHAESQVLATAGRPWILVVDSPIGIKKSKLTFSVHDGVLTGAMTDLFNNLLPISNITLSGRRMSWQLQITRPIQLGLTMEGVLDGQVLTGRVVSKYPDIPFTSQVPTA